MEGLIAVYIDSNELGGHEHMTIKVVSALSMQSIVFYYSDEVGAIIPEVVEKVKLPRPNSNPAPFFKNLNLWHIYLNYRVVKKWVTKHEIKNLIVSQGTIELGLKGVLIGRLLGLRTISYIPLVYFFREMNSQLAFIRDIVDEFYYRLPSSFIVLNENQKKILSGRGVVSPSYILPNPIEVEQKDVSFLLTAVKEEVRILYVGRLEERQKKVSRLLKMLPGPHSGLDFKLNVVGDGSSVNLIKEKNDPRIVMHGWCSKSVVSEHIRTTDFGVITSSFEGTPLVLFEFLSAGKPVLVQRSSWLNDFPASYPKKLIVNFDDFDIQSFLLEFNEDLEEISNELQCFYEECLVVHSQANFRRRANEIEWAW